MRERAIRLGFAFACVVVLSACTGGRPIDALGESRADSSAATDASTFFAARVQPEMDYCRVCHIPDGVADTDEGKRFQLSSDPIQDYDRTYAAWQAMGGEVQSNPLLVENADPSEPHSGGKNWPYDSEAYRSVMLLLSCWSDPTNCEFGVATDTTTPFPLLAEGHRGGHAWNRFCANRTDDAVLPPDPRTLIQPGVNEGGAVYFNAYYKDCHVSASPENADPTTCGEWRERIERGATLLKGNGAQGAAGNFIGNFPATDVLPTMSTSATAYNNMWLTWGLQERPDNYDELIANRWGVVLSPEPNSYPLPGEDPNETNGGSGQLPTALTQLREADGSWSGKIVATCHMCHSGQVGLPTEEGLPGQIYGTNSLSDIGVMARDMLPAGYSLMFVTGTLLTQTRGLGNITNFQLFNALSLPTTPENIPSWLLEQTSGGTGSEDPPVWWNYGHRPLKFFDGGMSSDAQRIAISAYIPMMVNNPYPGNTEGAFEWIEKHDQDAVAWLLSRRSPAYPSDIDTALAEQGAVLFHSKNLWAEEGNAAREKPRGGNGSCASCHGAYSPRFVNDPRYLEDPALEGIAGYIVPRDLIGTDPRRVDGNDQQVAQTFENDWFGYPEQKGTENDCGDQNLDRIRGDRENGYLAPPLYGVWASAPYFHNGSVPNVWEVLKSTDRKPFWRRVSAPNETGLDVVMGFDPSFERAYDQEHMGWKYEELSCGVENGLIPLLECDPTDPTANPLLDQVLSDIYANGGFAWNVPNLLMTPLTNRQIEDRKIYNTRIYSQDNGGHTFTDVLTDRERRAIIEYLKTL